MASITPLIGISISTFTHIITTQLEWRIWVAAQVGHVAIQLLIEYILWAVLLAFKQWTYAMDV